MLVTVRPVWVRHEDLVRLVQIIDLSEGLVNIFGQCSELVVLLFHQLLLKIFLLGFFGLFEQLSHLLLVLPGRNTAVDHDRLPHILRHFLNELTAVLQVLLLFGHGELILPPVLVNLADLLFDLRLPILQSLQVDMVARLEDVELLGMKRLKLIKLLL